MSYENIAAYNAKVVVAHSIREAVQTCLREIEDEESVKIFFACESGSRAWGFPSADSDYDVRFLYAHRRPWYLSIDLERKRDVIERPITDTLDISGWDLRKALQLFLKSNPPLLEWLQSPIIYREETTVASRFRDLIPVFYSPRKARYHYLHMAQGNYRDYLKGEEVWIKKYFYVLRPLLAILWIEADLGAVPMEFEILVERLVTSPSLRQAIDELLAVKRAGEEVGRGPRIAPISDFIEQELQRLASTRVEDNRPKPDVEALNRFFREALDELWPE